MVNVAVIPDHFEATIRDHPKMKLKEIQQRVASEIHVNVNLTRCKRAKKRVNERLSGNFKAEFALLWDYADELRAKNPADLDLEDGFGFTIISDQQKGLEIAINDILPRVEHRNCARHVFANWIGRKKPKSCEFDFWEIVKATDERDLEDKFEGQKR
ncbi:hypothetical protein V6N11_031881 [Hibiscus sabdariffa]|uniref:Uncharacterized protein n=1 Tax=Hibiscus sabdariffa TaxID=183260 RepID=A0ABR2SZP3_9ROSI